MIELRHLSPKQLEILNGKVYDQPEDLSSAADVLMVCRHILRVPEGYSMVQHCKDVMVELEVYAGQDPEE